MNLKETDIRLKLACGGNIKTKGIIKNLQAKLVDPELKNMREYTQISQ